MIPSYLKSLAATVRDLVVSGKAVHVTNETAAELDLLAGLRWQDADLARVPIGQQTHAILGSCDVFKHIPITPADLALGWLLASRALTHSVDVNDGLSVRDCAEGHEIDRAAECAELAVISAWYPVMPPGVERVRAEEDLSALYIGIPMLTVPYAGTREGARAAWGFALERMTVLLNEPLRDNATIEQWAVVLATPSDWITMNAKIRQVAPTIIDRYRRELEAM